MSFIIFHDFCVFSGQFFWAGVTYSLCGQTTVMGWLISHVLSHGLEVGFESAWIRTLTDLCVSVSLGYLRLIYMVVVAKFNERTNLNVETLSKLLLMLFFSNDSLNKARHVAKPRFREWNTLHHFLGGAVKSVDYPYGDRRNL